MQSEPAPTRSLVGLAAGVALRQLSATPSRGTPVHNYDHLHVQGYSLYRVGASTSHQ